MTALCVLAAVLIGAWLTVGVLASTLTVTGEANGNTTSGSTSDTTSGERMPGARVPGGDYIAFGTTPKGEPMTYGTDGNGDPRTDDCTTTVKSNPQGAIDGAAPGAVVCVRPGDYSGTTLTISKPVTVRATGVVKIKAATLNGSDAVLDGFTVVGGPLDNPSQAISYAGTGHKIINNLKGWLGGWLIVTGIVLLLAVTGLYLAAREPEPAQARARAI